MLQACRVRVVIFGYGYWGRILAHNINAHPGMECVAVVDPHPDNRTQAGKDYPGFLLFESGEDCLGLSGVDAWVVASNAATHFAICDLALSINKHVLVTKPVCSTLSDVETLLESEGRSSARVMVDHTFLFDPHILRIKEMLDSQELGRILYAESDRGGMGIVKSDVSIIEDLTVHDLSIFQYLFSSVPDAASVYLPDYFDNIGACSAYVDLKYGNDVYVSIRSHWHYPEKHRRLVICGDLASVIWDVSDGGGLRLVSAGFEFNDGLTIMGRERVGYRAGPVRKISVLGDTLRNELDAFVRMIVEGGTTPSDLTFALSVMQTASGLHKAASRVRMVALHE